MNKDLKDRIFDIPENILEKISKTVMNLNGQYTHGKDRAEKLLRDQKVKYGQLKKIIHELQNMDKVKEKLKFELAGGDLMLNWAKTFLDGERDMVSGRKDSRKRADEIGGLTGERKNSHLKKHSKKPDFLPPLNLVKSNSHKSSISAFSSMKLFEEVEKIKKLML